METLIDYFRRLEGYEWWRVGIELFLIGLLVYWAVDFLEGTRGERLFRGVIFILIGVLILNLVIERFGFERLQYLYKGFLIFIFIIAVAGFQPEIRRVLMRIGQPDFFKSSPRQAADTFNQIITAVKDLSITKTGAIIVIEKNVGLAEFIETGIKIDAKVSPELLKTIFWTGTPLHDMAVIINKDKIAAARVQLPLAEEGSIEGAELGSRHRAAIGITMSSDAVVVVVSEETGIISVARNGKLERNLTESQLRSFLTEVLEEDSSGDLNL